MADTNIPLSSPDGKLSRTRGRTNVDAAVGNCGVSIGQHLNERDKIVKPLVLHTKLS